MSRAPLLTFIECMSHPDVFGDWFSGPSWDRWRVVGKAVFGLPMDDDELELFTSLTGRTEAPTEPAKEAWLIFGRRGGKDVMAAAYVVWLATIGALVYGWRSKLVRGEKGVVQLLAVDRDQAAVCFGYIRAYFEKPVLAKMVKRVTADSIELKNDITIEVTTNDRRRVRGRTVCAAVLDEVAHWRSENTANPDEDVYAAIQPATLTMPNALILGISSPYSRKGLLWRKYDEHYAKPGPILVAKAPTWVMHPAITRDHELIQRAYARDPADASAEYGAEFRSDLEAFVTLEAVRACIELGVRERMPDRRNRYVAFVDPSGGSSDSMTLAIAHKDKDVAVLDAIREIAPPFSPDAVVEEFAGVCKAYGCSKVYGDRYGGEWPREAFRRHLITYEPSDKSKSEIYKDALPLINSRCADLLDNDCLVAQLVGLERRTTRGGRDSIDHAPGAHDDLANAAMGSLVLVAARSAFPSHVIANAFTNRIKPLWPEETAA